MDRGRPEWNQIWITAHETDVTPILHYRKDIACEQRGFAIPARRPVKKGATFEMAPAVDQRQAIPKRKDCAFPRSEEHTSELQSHSDLVCRLLLEKKKKI